MSYTKNKRDGNEDAILELWRRLGCVWIEQPRENGFDGLLCRMGETWVVEIKDGGKPSSKRKLTPNEIERKAELEGIGAAYNIINNEQEAAALVRLSFE